MAVRTSRNARAIELGGYHQSTRQTALAVMPEGQPCARCETRGITHPMTRAVISRSEDGLRWVAPLLDLDDFPGRAFGGPQVKRLSWRACNRSAGATLGNRMRGVRRAAMKAAIGGPLRTSRQWLEPACDTCGQPYRRAPRSCEICGKHYHPNHADQRSCSRACGVAIRHRDATYRQRTVWPFCKIHVRPCDHCGELFTGRTLISRFCSPQCTWHADNLRRRGEPKQFRCPCGEPISARRKKCDDCVRDTRRQRKRREKARARERAKVGAGGSDVQLTC